MKEPWIKAGYESFAYNGPNTLKVERLAKQVEKNKSSFYHHFGDLEVFTEELLQHHMEQSKVIAFKEANCETQQELVDVLVFHKVDLLFNRQLRVHRSRPDFRDCFEQVLELSQPSFMKIWTKITGLEGHPHLAKLVLSIGVENFYLQINEETLNPVWLNGYFSQFKTLINEFRKLEKKEAIER